MQSWVEKTAEDPCGRELCWYGSLPGHTSSVLPGFPRAGWSPALCSMSIFQERSKQTVLGLTGEQAPPSSGAKCKHPVWEVKTFKHFVLQLILGCGPDFPFCWWWKDTLYPQQSLEGSAAWPGAVVLTVWTRAVLTSLLSFNGLSVQKYQTRVIKSI